jgi:hypothetical protein
MSYNDDEELEIGEVPDILEDDDFDAPLLDDDLISTPEEDEDEITDFAGLDGSSDY